jgi:MraZ protein
MSRKTYALMSQEATTLYSGTFERSMDAKKRVAVPAPWLSSGEGEVFHIVPHPSDGYLMVMPPAEFDRWENEFRVTGDRRRSEWPSGSFTAKRTPRRPTSRAPLLSDKHCERAGLSRGIFVGVGVDSRSGAARLCRLEVDI